MWVPGVKTLEQANEYLLSEYLAWWEREMTVEAASADDAHRPLDNSHDLAASLSHVETRQVRNDYTVRWGGKLYQIERHAVTPGLRQAVVRVEARLDGTLAVQHQGRYLPVRECAEAVRPAAAVAVQPARQPSAKRGRSSWMDNFHLGKRKTAAGSEPPAASLRRTGKS